MKFGVRQCANIVFRAKQETKIGDKLFHVGQPVLYIDSATTSSLEQAATTVYAQGGRGNARLIAWEGEKTMTFTLTDALLSPIGFHVLSGCGLFKKGDNKGKTGEETGDLVHFHMTTRATMVVANTGTEQAPAYKGTIDLTEALIRFGFQGTTTRTGKAAICTTDAPIYIMTMDADGGIDGGLISGNIAITEKTKRGPDNKDVTYKSVIEVTGMTGITDNVNVMVDYYIDLPGANVWEMDVTQNTFGGYYYVEADTLFRQKSNGKDLPANLTFPNVKIQSNFTMTFAATGDPSTFDFTMDAFPGYTYFDKTKEVLCVFQIVDDAWSDISSVGDPVMYHDQVLENFNTENPRDSLIDYTGDSNNSIPG